MNRSMTNNQVVQPEQAGSGQEPTNIQRRTLIGGALAALLSFPGRAMAQGHAVPDDSFVLLLKGLYRPVVKGPNPVPGRYLEGTFELTILEATGISINRL